MHVMNRLYFVIRLRSTVRRAEPLFFPFPSTRFHYGGLVFTEPQPVAGLHFRSPYDLLHLFVRNMAGVERSRQGFQIPA